MLNIVPQAI